MANTYLQNSLNSGKIVRWPDTVSSLTVYIAPFRWYKSNNDDLKYRKMVMNAFQMWEKALNGKIKFIFVQNLNDSQINLEWRRIDRKSLGDCYFHFDNFSRLYSAEIKIGLSDGIIHSQYQDEDEVFHTVLHEIGHALGIGGHSPFEGDIMFTPHRYGVVSLSKNDISTIKWLYRFPCGANIDEIALKYKSNNKNLDKIVLEQSKSSSEFEHVKNSIQKEKRNLLEEQTKLAELKKYNMQIQNLKFSFKPNKLK